MRESLSAAGKPDANAAKTFCPERSRVYVLVSAILASAMGFIDGTVVSIAMPAIRESLSASLIDAVWISNAYLITLSALILLGGALGDRFGLRRVFAIGIGGFVIASLACAAAPSAAFLIIARFVQGMFAAVMIPASLAIISKAYPRNLRAKAIGTWIAASAITTAAGPIIGGLLLSAGPPEAWRIIFAINLLVGALTLYFLLFKVPADDGADAKPLDIAGSLAITLCLGLAAYALTGSEGEGSLPSAGHMLFFGTPAIVLLIVFILIEHRQSAPIVPPALFANSAFTSANVVTLMLYFALSAILFFLPMTLIGAWGIEEAQAGLMYVPFTLFIALLSSRFGAWSETYGYHRFIAAGCALTGTAYAVLGLGMVYQSFWWHVIPAIALAGLGMAMVVSPLSTVVMLSVDDARSGIASGINNAVSRAAGLIAVATMGGVAGLFYKANGGKGSFGVEFPGSEEIHVIASNDAFSAVAYSAAAFCFLGGVIGWRFSRLETPN